MTTVDEVTMNRIDELVLASDPTSEPLMSAMAAGQLSRDDLRVFAGQYFHLIDRLPRFLSTVHGATEDPNWRRVLLNVLVPLEAKPPSAADLWLQTCAALGLFSDTVRSGEPSNATNVCLNDFEYLCQAGAAQGFAALYAWMSRLPKICRVMQDALAQHYDLTSGPGVQFFDVMSFQTTAHSRALRTALAEILATYPEASPAAEHASVDAINAVKGMYAGVLSGVR